MASNVTPGSTTAGSIAVREAGAPGELAGPGTGRVVSQPADARQVAVASFDVADFDVSTDDDTGAAASGDPEEIAQAAVQAVIDRDCATVLALGTVDLVQGQAEELCTGELLPADTTITDVETVGDDPLVVSVEVDAGGDSFDIELTFVENQGLLLIDDYQW